MKLAVLSQVGAPGAPRLTCIVILVRARCTVRTTSLLSATFRSLCDTKAPLSDFCLFRWNLLKDLLD